MDFVDENRYKRKQHFKHTCIHLLPSRQHCTISEHLFATRILNVSIDISGAQLHRSMCFGSNSTYSFNHPFVIQYNKYVCKSMYDFIQYTFKNVLFLRLNSPTSKMYIASHNVPTPDVSGSIESFLPLPEWRQ